MNKKQDLRLDKILSILGFIAIVSALIVIFKSDCLAAPTPNISLPDINIGTNKPKTPTEMALPIQLLFFLTTLSMAPYLLFMTTAFIRVSIVCPLFNFILAVASSTFFFFFVVEVSQNAPI